MGVVSRAVHVGYLVTVLMASATTSLDSVVISSKPHQPLSIRFPKRSFGKKRTVERSFQPSWFTNWPFLHYDEAKDAVYCHTCLDAFKLIRMKTSMRADPAFVSSLT